MSTAILFFIFIFILSPAFYHHKLFIIIKSTKCLSSTRMRIILINQCRNSSANKFAVGSVSVHQQFYFNILSTTQGYHNEFLSVQTSHWFDQGTETYTSQASNQPHKKENTTHTHTVVWGDSVLWGDR